MDPELRLSFAISQMKSALDFSVWEEDAESGKKSKVISLMIRIMSLVMSMDLDSHPEPDPEVEPGLISLIKQTISVGKSIPDSEEPELQLVSLVARSIPLIGSAESEPELTSLVGQLYSSEGFEAGDSELSSLILQIISHARFTLYPWSEPDSHQQLSGGPMDSGSQLLTAISQIGSSIWDEEWEKKSKFISLMI
ncbi:PREDICTED: uncharacterized protein LOC104736598 [Camelina sativa]|uniref:Uncharacterized protein LOC104736598 n=1 Tax=Camelina sativa TaxID=90675 RepID=A0ABM0VEE6_CAMSA|nr:PREDICTED: uncharacterized protein LOC104736598 [Camelina sativa]